MGVDPDELHRLPWTDWAPWVSDLDIVPVRQWRHARSWGSPWTRIGTPLLYEVAGPGPWWQSERIRDTLDRSEPRALAAAFAQACLGHAPDRELGQLLPHLPLDMHLGDLPAEVLGPVTGSALHRLGEHVADVAVLSVPDLLNLRNWGFGRIGATIAALMEASLTTRTTTLPGVEPLPPQHHTLLEDLTVFAEWLRLCGDGTARIIDFAAAGVGSAAPRPVQDAAQRLYALTVQEFLPDPPRDDPVAQIQAAVNALAEGHRLVLDHRILADDPAPERDLAQLTGVGAASVSDLERQTRNQLQAAFAKPPLALIVHAAQQFVDEIGPLERLLDELPVLEREIPGIGRPIWQVLSRTTASWHEQDGWIGKSPVTRTAARTYLDIAAIVDDTGTASLETVHRLLPGRLFRRSEALAWLAYCGIDTTGGRVAIPAPSIADLAARLLAAAGAPMAFRDLYDRIGDGAQPESVQNTLSKDQRFMHTDVDVYALASWGLKPYPASTPSFATPSNKRRDRSR